MGRCNVAQGFSPGRSTHPNQRLGKAKPGEGRRDLLSAWLEIFHISGLRLWATGCRSSTLSEVGMPRIVA